MKKLIFGIGFIILGLTGCTTQTQTTIADIEIPLTTGVDAALEPEFSPTTYDYTLDVPNDIANVELITKANNQNDKILINGKEKVDMSKDNPSLSADSTPLELNEGENNVVVSVETETGKADYNITINRDDYSQIREKFLKLSYKSEDLGIEMPYRLYVPESYEQNSDQEYPLVFFLHGSGERGDDNELPLANNIGGTVWATDEVQSKNESFVLVPQARNGDETTGFGLTRDANGINLDNVYTLSDDTKVAKEILDQVISEYRIDENRIYSTGVSQGAFGTWALNLEYPDLFAKMVPVAGGGDPNNPNLAKLVDKPIWEFHAASDPVIPVEQATNVTDKLTELGGNPKVTIYDEDEYFYPIAHFSWISAYHNQEMLEWMFKE